MLGQGLATSDQDIVEHDIPRRLMRIKPDQLLEDLVDFFHVDQAVLDVGYPPLSSGMPAPKAGNVIFVEHQIKPLVDMVVLIPWNLFQRMDPAEKRRLPTWVGAST